MQRKSLAALIVGALMLLFGFIGRAASVDALYLLSGMCFVALVAIALSYLPFWRRFRDRVPAMPGLFPRAGHGQWDPNTGQIRGRTRK